MKSFALSFALLSFFSSTCLGQTPTIDQSKVPMPPTAASFARYTDIPVSHYTGVPNISIPIYTVKHKGIEVPIELTYHSGGNRISDYGTWVGLGWSLQPGGLITREIRDKDDFDPTSSFFRSTHLIPSSLDEGGMVYQSGGCTIRNGGSSMASSIMDDLAGKNPGISTYDWAPDIFTFNFNGITGKFILNQDRKQKPKVVGESMVATIEYAGERSYDGFIITTKDGNRYYFLQNGRTFYTGGGTGRSHDFSWSLNKIESPRGEIVEFNYYNEKEQTATISQMAINYREKLNFQYFNSFECPPQNSNCVYFPSKGAALSACYDDQIANPGFSPTSSRTFITSEPILKSIVTPWTQVEFNVGQVEGHYRLESVEVFSRKTDSLIKKYIFGYDHYYDSNHREKGKLKLTAVQEQGKPAYRFEYYNNFSTKYGLGDHWGMYNGTESYDVPLIQFEYWDRDFNSFVDKKVKKGISRETHPELLKAGIIKSIFYPTGGKTTFEFEAHTFDANNINDESNPVVTKSYHSEGFSTSDKSLLIEGDGNYYYNTHQVYADIKIGFTNPEDYSNLDYLRETSVSINNYRWSGFGPDEDNPLKNVSGTGMGFWIPVALGKKLEVYMDIPQGSSGVIDVNLRYDKRRYAGGLRVKSIEYNDGLGGVGQVDRFFYGDQINLEGGQVEGKSYGRLISPPVYFVLYGNSYYTSGAGFECLRMSVSNQSVLPNLSPIIGYDKVVVQKEGIGREELFFLNSSAAVSGSDIPGFPSFVNFKNGELDRRKVYSEDGALLLESINMYKQMEMTMDVGSIYYVDDVLRSIWKVFGNCLDGVAGFITYPIYTEWNVLSSTETYNYGQNGGEPLLSVTDYKYDNPVHKNLTQTINYGSDGSKLIRTTTYPADYSNDDGFIGALKSSFIHTTPIEEVLYRENAGGVSNIIEGRISEYNENGKGELNQSFALEATPINTEKFKFSNKAEVGQLPFSSEGVDYKQDTMYEPKVGYVYDDVSNLKSEKPIDDYETQYIWGYDLSLVVAIVENATYADIEAKLGKDFTLGSTDGNSLSDSQIEALRSIPDARVTTYTYDPLIGLTSQTDPNGIKTFYKYDSNGRLELVRDQDENVVKSYNYRYHAP